MFSYSVDSWVSDLEPWITTSLFYNGKDLSAYIDTNIEIVFTLVDDAEKKKKYSRHIHMIKWNPPSFATALP